MEKFTSNTSWARVQRHSCTEQVSVSASYTSLYSEVLINEATAKEYEDKCYSVGKPAAASCAAGGDKQAQPPVCCLAARVQLS